MLAFLRKRAQSLVIQAIVVVIALVFIFWGVGTNMMNKQDAAIVVNKEEISFSRFQQAYDQAYARIAQQFGGTIPRELLDGLNIRQQVINQLVQEALLRQGAHAMGLAVSAREVQQEIESMVQFQSNGTFDLERYQSVLAANRLAPSKYEESLKHELLAEKTIDSIAAFVTSVSDAEIDDLYMLENETVAVEYIVVSPESRLADIEIEEAAPQQWYETAGNRYQTEPMVRLTYLPFRHIDTAQKIVLEEDEIARYFERNQEQFRIPESRRARHILFRVGPDATEEELQQQREKAQAVLQQAGSGEDFAELARTHSEDGSAEDGGDLGFFTRGQMVKPFEDAVFAMEESAVSDLVRTDFGFHIIKLETIQPGGLPKLDEVREQIDRQLRLERARMLTFELAGTVYEEIIGAGSLSGYLTAHPDATVVKTDFFGRIDAPDEITADPKFLDMAFTLKEGELSSLIEIADGYAIISVDAIREPYIPELSQVRERVEQDYRREQANAAARDIARNVLERLQAGTDLKTAAAEHDLTTQLSGPMKKQGNVNEQALPPSLVEEAFRLNRATPYPENPGEAGGAFYVFHFLERTPPETSMDEADRQYYRQMLMDFKRRQLVDAWLQSRQEQAVVTIHRSVRDY